MRTIPFDIKYRPQIESGEYKVVTDKGNEVRILDWNLNRYGRNDIVCAVKAESSDNETVQIYYDSGVMVSNGTSMLKIETNEPELTEFEEAVNDLLNRFSVYVEDDDVIKREAAKLLKIANESLCNSPSVDEYKRGWDARADYEPHWVKSECCGVTNSRFRVVEREETKDRYNDVLYDQSSGYEISIMDLVCKLPKRYV